MSIINWCWNKLYGYNGFHLKDEIYCYGLLLFLVVMTERVYILVTYLPVVWDIPVMRIIKWCLKKFFYYLRLSNEELTFIAVITFVISLAENALEGTSTFLQILFAITLDNYPGRFKLVVYSTISYIFGALGLLLFQETDRNTNTEIPRFCLLLLQTTRLTARNEVFLKVLPAEKVIPTREEKKERHQSRIHSWCLFAVNWVELIICLSLSRFLSHAEFCNHDDPMCSAIFEVLSVIQIVVLKRRIVIATTEKQLLNSHKSSTRIVPRISWWSDKAPFAIEEENRPGKPCTVAQVKELKFCLGMVPMWTTFLIFSLVDATGSTFFLEQASNIGHNFPVTVFNILVTVTSFAIDYLWDFLFRKIGNEMNGRHIMQWRIGVGMSFSFICCIFAYAVRRLVVHMDIFSLTLQFLLLGIMKGLSERGLQSLFRSLLSESLRDYRTPFGECVMVIGKFLLSTLCILIFKSWFGHDIDSSCVDNYYAILTVISFVNLVIFRVALANCYGDDQSSPQKVDCEQPIEGARDSFGPSVLLSFSDQTPNNLQYISVSTRRTRSLPDMMPNNPPYISVSPRITRSFSASARLITSNRLDDAHAQENELHIEIFDCEHHDVL